MYPMFFQDGDIYSGFEIDLATEIVRRLFGNQVAISWVPLNPEERIPSVESGRVDFLIRNTTHTKSRDAQVLFTSNYFLDGVRLLVRRSEGYQGIEDLDGKTIVLPIDNSVPALQNAATKAGVSINILVNEDASTVFNGRLADAIATDWSSHGLFVDDYNAHQSVGELFSSEPLAILVSLRNSDFRDEIDSTLLGIIADGTWQTIYDRWFPEPPPWTIEEMLAEPPADR
jgi:putative glutamine transport system substrate-binding protein